MDHAWARELRDRALAGGLSSGHSRTAAVRAAPTLDARFRLDERLPQLSSCPNESPGKISLPTISSDF